jgi:hypothetical protein
MSPKPNGGHGNGPYVVVVVSVAIDSTKVFAALLLTLKGIFFIFWWCQGL